MDRRLFSAQIAFAMLAIDRAIFLAFHALRPTPTSSWLWRNLVFFFSQHALDLFLYAFIVLAVFGKAALRRKAWDGVLVYFLSGELAETYLKRVFARPRPGHDQTLQNLVHVLGRVPAPTSYSFPSGSAFVAAACGYWLASEYNNHLERRRLATTGIALFTLGICASRVIAGVHYPSDVAFGALGGLGFSWWMRRTLLRFDRS